MIGSVGSLPQFADRAEREEVLATMSRLTLGANIIIGSVTAGIMQRLGLTADEAFADRNVFVWSRSAGISPATFIHRTQELAPMRPTFIMGGRQTFETFAHFCTSHILLRATLKEDGPPLYMPPVFAEWGYIGGTMRRPN